MTVKNPTHISFFDLDNTLLTVNSGFKFGLFLFRKKVLPFNRLFYLIGYYLWFRLGLISPKEINEKACHIFLNRISLKKLRLYVTQFLDCTLEDSINQKVFSCLVESQQEGRSAVILSSSPDFLVSEICKRLGVEQWGATDFNVDTFGVISGVKKHMDGIEKAAYLKKICCHYAISSKETTVYSDSFFDLPFLQAAGTAIAVNPDKKLRQFSLANNWKII